MDVAALAARYRRACDDEIGVELRESFKFSSLPSQILSELHNAVGGAHREQAVTRLMVEFVTDSRPYRSRRRQISCDRHCFYFPTCGTV